MSSLINVHSFRRRRRRRVIRWFRLPARRQRAHRAPRCPGPGAVTTRRNGSHGWTQTGMIVLKSISPSQAAKPQSHDGRAHPRFYLSLAPAIPHVPQCS